MIEQIEPPQFYGTKVRPDSNKGSSVWDAMHPADIPPASNGNLPPRPPSLYHKTVQQINPQPNPESAKIQRRDPIGYFEDNKFGGSFGSHLPNNNPGPSFNRNISANTQEKTYQPSWSASQSQAPPSPQQNGPQSANDLLENAMMYQRPVGVANGYSN